MGLGGQTRSNLLYVDLVLPEEVKDDTEDTTKIKTVFKIEFYWAYPSLTD